MAFMKKNGIDISLLPTPYKRVKFLDFIWKTFGNDYVLVYY